jgi:hypothetical protein
VAYSVYCIANGDSQAVRIANRLRTGGFSASDISVLAAIEVACRLGHHNSAKAPEGGGQRRDRGLLGGALGWLAGIGRCHSRRRSLIQRAQSGNAFSAALGGAG